MKDQAEGLRRMADDFYRERMEDAKGSRPRGQRVLAVASGKGGVGKTNLSANLSIALAKRGHRVLVMDVDLGLANVNIALGELPKWNLYHVLKGEKRLEDCVTRSKHGIDLIAGASGFGELANLAEDQRMRFVEQMAALRSYEFLVLDTGAGISDNVTSFLLAADRILVVTTPEPTAVTDAYGLIKALASKGVSTKGQRLDIRLVVNRAETLAEGRQVSERISAIARQFLRIDIKYLGVIFDDPIVGKAVRAKIPFTVFDPKSKASVCIDTLAARVLDEPAPEPSEGGGFSRFFQKMFGT